MASVHLSVCPRSKFHKPAFIGMKVIHNIDAHYSKFLSENGEFIFSEYHLSFSYNVTQKNTDILWFTEDYFLKYILFYFKRNEISD